MTDGAAPGIDGAAVLGLIRGMDADPSGLLGGERAQAEETAGNAQRGRRRRQASVEVVR